jgi:YggT family protein
VLLPAPIAELISLIITILIIAVFIRALLSYFPGATYSSFGRVLVQGTDWLLVPIQRVVPPMAGIDFSPLIAILLLYAIRAILVSGDLIGALLSIVGSILAILIIALFIRVFLGFFRMDPWHPVVQMIDRGTEPFARPFRSWLPRRFGHFDWAPVAALVVLLALFWAVNYVSGHRTF